jgi:hypothetical protein
VKRFWVLGALAAIALVAAGCVPATVTGGGSGTSGLQQGAKSNFGISSTCTSWDSQATNPICLDAKISGTYHDRGVNQAFPNGVMLAFTGVAHFCESTDPCEGPAVGGFGDFSGPEWAGVVSYRSQDRKHPGTGCAVVFAVDSNQNGKPDKGDVVAIEISQTALDLINGEAPTNCTVAGVYNGYENSTSVSGNITVRTLVPVGP